MAALRYMLDTNIVSDLVRLPNGETARRAASLEPGAIAVSIVVAAELRYGAARRRSARLTRQLEAVLSALETLPLAAPADVHYGTIRRRTGGASGPHDRPQRPPHRRPREMPERDAGHSGTSAGSAAFRDSLSRIGDDARPLVPILHFARFTTPSPRAPRPALPYSLRTNTQQHPATSSGRPRPLTPLRQHVRSHHSSHRQPYLLQ